MASPMPQDKAVLVFEGFEMSVKNFCGPDMSRRRVASASPRSASRGPNAHGRGYLR
eukprot:CAMPEP_0176223936 /NCGR_PEP_ID=MMETSP0121_2-20121125/20999_1 /TAXON_ID=160619 /ORGANISM="Kryptoperidinium foliaceum, Strain CCMP 1326" /LENGTH=55 /DNA_ID=CAMNT_0017563181 /DNA_START=575 /DNA_END=738 /DNA_ORIENTATION=+